MSSGYRLAPALAARLVGLLLVVLAGAGPARDARGGAARRPDRAAARRGRSSRWWPCVALAVPLRGVRVVELDDEGYRVRMIRGAGVRAAAWRDVEDAVAASPHGVDCVVLRLRDGRTTSIPVAAVDAPREDFVRGPARPPEARRGAAAALTAAGRARFGADHADR